MDVAASGMAVAPFPIPAHRTGRADFRHPALRLASAAYRTASGPMPARRWWSQMHTLEAQDAVGPEDFLCRRAAGYRGIAPCPDGGGSGAPHRRRGCPPPGRHWTSYDKSATLPKGTQAIAQQRLHSWSATGSLRRQIWLAYRLRTDRPNWGCSSRSSGCTPPRRPPGKRRRCRLPCHRCQDPLANGRSAR